ncbi:polysialyltransferase family glycosyltransferase [Marivirga salinae]|uniref:Polysialyltransferase family glycosyltransferase n=1 Tax=Marivirga salinarum TaxID=3059078 RepID=A0AA51N920_9BACT|nr:polysialyltransferase family glycosyltransferase [Marivirga sp. BDSF4-3]WMN10917.1 polysialyltransferase family glycosyltransferase [Marivirga sp. BDSF4-3]
MKRILAIWPTHREDWILPFKALSNQFEFIFLSGISPDEEKETYVQDFAQTIHWSDYSSAQDLLAQIQADKLVFMSIDSGLNIALNINAKKHKISTYILQHGIYTNYKDYRTREKIWQKKELAAQSNQAKSSSGFSSFQWINNSLSGIQKLILLPITLFIKASQKVGPYWAAKHLSFEAKKPNQYICFSPFNATIHKEVDKIGEERIQYIGSPELTQYLKEENDLIQEDFYLHIDQAFAENSFGEETVSKENMIQFYLKLNEFCLQQNAKLYIKLHPESFNSDWLPQDDNIIYIRKVENFNRYVQSAKGCFGFYSTMVIPAVYWKPTILFNIFYSGLQEALEDIEQVKILAFHQFSVDDLNFNKGKLEQDKLINRFFYSKEAISLELLAEILNAEN